MAAWTEADRDKLKAAIASGGALQSMTFGNQSFTFRSLDEMLKLLALMEQELTAGQSRTRYAAFDKGV